MRSLPTLALLAVGILAAGCSTSGGDALSSDVYDVPRDQVFDAMRQALDADYDLDKVDRKSGRITTHYDMSHAAAVYSQDGWRTKAEGKISEAKLPDDPKRTGYKADIKVFFETNQDKDDPLNPRADSTAWRKEGTNATLERQVVDYMDTLLKEFGPSEIWLRRHADQQ